MIALLLIAVGVVLLTPLASAWVAGRDLPKRPTPFLCWTCGCPHTDTTLCCAHCQEVTA